MSLIKGYIAKYDMESLLKGMRFAPGCFGECDGQIIPVVDSRTSMSEPNRVIGHAMLETREDGLYCKCDLNDDKLYCIPRSFTFYANHVEKMVIDNTSEIRNAQIKEVGISDSFGHGVTYIEEYTRTEQ